MLIFILKFINFIKVGKGKTPFQEGDKGYYICFVIDGRFDIIKETIPKDMIVLNILSRWQLFGEMAIIENSPRSVTEKTCTKAKVEVLARKDLHILSDDYPEIGVNIL